MKSPDATLHALQGFTVAMLTVSLSEPDYFAAALFGVGLICATWAVKS